MRIIINLIFIILFQFQVMGQNINYLENKNSYFIQKRHFYENGKISDVDTFTFDKCKRTFWYFDSTVFYLPDTKPTIKNFQEQVNKHINVEKMPKIEYSTILCLIISNEGNIMDINIIKGEGYPYDYEVIKAVKKTEGWIPGTYKEKNVNSLVFMRYKYIIE